MHFILRDWDRIWYLAFSPEAKRCPGTAVEDFRTAQLILSRLIRDGGNLSVMRSMLASECAPGGRAIPMQEGPLLIELARRLARRNCILLRGAPHDLRTGGVPGFRAAGGGADELEAGSFATADGNPDSDEGLPILLFTGECEQPIPVRFAHGADKHPGMAFAYASERGPALRFADAAEGRRALGHSAMVKAPP